MDKQYIPTKKQALAHRSKAKYLLFGGSAGGAKTTWLVNAAIGACVKHPGIRGYLCRHQLTSFRRSTLVTLLEWLPTSWIRQHHKTEHFIEFHNSSRIYYGGLGDDVRAIEKLKSLELSFYGIEEASETSEQFFFMLNSRLRQKIPGVEYKAWLTSMPTSNWVRARWIEHSFDEHEFIPSLPADNPHLPSSYIPGLRKILPENLVRIWVEGSWSEMQEENAIFDYGHILRAMQMIPTIPENAKICYGVDVARMGSDSNIIMKMNGPLVTIEEVFTKSLVTETAGRVIRRVGMDKKVPIKIDSIGIGAGVADILKEQGYNVIEIIASAKAIEHTRFKNLRAENLFNVSDLISKEETSLPDDEKLRSEMHASRYRIFSDGLILAESKEEIRRRLGYSPDRLDALAILLSGEGHIGVEDGDSWGYTQGQGFSDGKEPEEPEEPELDDANNWEVLMPGGNDLTARDQDFMYRITHGDDED